MKRLITIEAVKRKRERATLYKQKDRIDGGKREKGITLVTLVVTIIVLLMLAGVTLTTVFKGDVIFHIASESANMNKIAKIQEELELLKTLVMPGTLDDYMEKLIAEKEKYRIENEEEDIEQLDAEHWTVVIEGRYEFLIYTNPNIGMPQQKISSRSSIGKSTSGNIVIEFQGEVNTGLLVLSEKSGTLQYPNTRIFSVTKNTSGGKLSVISDDDSIASASIEGNIVTVTPKLTNENKKRVRITVISEPRGKYLRQKAKYTATVNKGSITIEATEYKGEYDGKKHPVLTDITVDPEDAKVTYSIGDGAYQEEIPEVEMTGEYTVSIKAEKEGYETKQITKTVTVKKQKNKEGNLTLSETSGIITYPTEKTIEVTSNTSGGELSVSSSDESILTAKLEGNTITMTPQIIEEDEQKVTITVTSKETENYEEQTATYDAVVNRGSITINATPYTGTYNGNSYPAVSNISTSPADCTLTYSLNGGEYKGEVPQVSNANTYTTVIKAEKAGYVTKEESKTITINKQGNVSGNLVLSETRGTLNYPTPRTFTVTKNTSGGELSVVSNNTNVVTASISGNTITLTPKEVDSSTTITVKSAATGNYAEQTATYTATVISNKAPSKPTVSFNSKGTNYIKVNARSTDTDTNDKLTYTLRYGTSSSNLNYSTSLSNQTPGQTINITASTNINPYTYYYWRVDVTDGKAVVTGDVQYGPRTYCAASPCNGGSQEYHSCPPTVTISGSCGSTARRTTGGASTFGWTACYFCGSSTLSGHSVFVCNDFKNCGITFELPVCFNHAYTETTTCQGGQRTITCTTCNGNGYYYTYSNCTHGYGYGSSHYYCDKAGHGNYRGSSSLHD